MSPNTERVRVIVSPTADEATRAVADILLGIIRQAVTERGVCHVALSGGTTPHRLYQLLAQGPFNYELPWAKVMVFFGDERDVPYDHIESNYNMVQRTLLDNVPIEVSRVHPMPADMADLAAGAQRYEELIRSVVPADSAGIPRFDLILLGMGGDGHTASLFPHTEALTETRKLVVVHFVPVLSRHRMTFTFPLINAARHVVMLVTGDDKAQAVSHLLSDDPQDRANVPAARVHPADGQLTIVLDSPAARRATIKTNQA